MLVFPCRLKYPLNRKVSIRHPLLLRAVLRVGHSGDFFYSCHPTGNTTDSIQVDGLAESGGGRGEGCIPAQECIAGNCNCGQGQETLCAGWAMQAFTSHPCQRTADCLEIGSTVRDLEKSGGLAKIPLHCSTLQLGKETNRPTQMEPGRCKPAYSSWRW